MIIKNNLKLIKIHIKTKQHIDIHQLEITGNPQLQSIIVSTPKNFAGSIWIRDNGELTSLELDFSKMDGADFILESNLLLTTLKMDTITSITLSGDFKIVNNPMLATMTLDNVTKIDFDGNLQIENNPSLLRLGPPALTNIRVVQQLVVKNNNFLEKFEFPAGNKFDIGDGL